jgi:hypothetical protein
MLVFALPAVPHDTVTGQRPGFVLLPTVHDQVIREPFFAPSPRASERPLAYTTAIVHREAGETLTVTDALSPAVTEPAGVTIFTAASAAPARASAARLQARARHVRTYPSSALSAPGATSDRLVSPGDNALRPRYCESMKHARVMITSLAAVCATAAAIITSGAVAAFDLTHAVPEASQVGAGYKLVQRQDGHGTEFVTLDLCGFRFSSESARAERYQVNYVSKRSAVGVSNEVVVYEPGGAAYALSELRKAVRKCAKRTVSGPEAGGSTLTYRVSRLEHPGSRLLTDALPLALNVSGTVNGEHVEFRAAIVYQVLDNVLSGTYAYGGSGTQRAAAVLRAAAGSAAHLRRLTATIARTA